MNAFEKRMIASIKRQETDSVAKYWSTDEVVEIYLRYMEKHKKKISKATINGFVEGASKDGWKLMDLDGVVRQMYVKHVRPALMALLDDSYDDSIDGLEPIDEIPF